jgi:glycosyltransferase involved in cell wall biosynthesis
MTSAQPDAPRFSIITIGRNDLAGLKVAAQSITSQTCQDLEWIVSDGASTDGSAEWLESANLAYLDFISEPDKGIQDAYNKGIARATGEILVFINSGDMFAANETLALVDQDQKMRGWLWAYGAMNVVDSERNVIDVNNWRNFSKWQLRMGLHSIGHQSAFFTRDLVAKVGLYRSEVGVQSDQDFMLRAADLAEPAYIDAVLALLETGGVSSGLEPDAFVRKAQMIRQMDDRLLWGSTLADSLLTSVLAATKRVRHRIWLMRGGGTS